MKRREFIYGLSCMVAGYALANLRHLPKFTIKKEYNENEIPGLTVAVSSHCNLNCKGCDTFSPLAKEEFTTLAQFEKDFKRLKEIYNADKSICAFLGGEPLLNPELTKMIIRHHQLFPNGSRNILTNGLLLNEMNDNFWKTLKETGTGLNITKYPIDINREKYEAKAEKYGINIDYAHVKSDKLYDLKTKKVIKENEIQEGLDWSKNILDITGSQKIDHECPHRGIHVYARGNVYACYVHAYINAFIDYFKLDIPITKDDYIKIQDVKEVGEIERFLESPKPLCRYCKQCHNICYGDKPLEWNFSKREITEWT